MLKDNNFFFFSRKELELFNRVWIHSLGCQEKLTINMSNENSCRCNLFASRHKSSVKCTAWGGNFPFCSYGVLSGHWTRTANRILSLTGWQTLPSGFIFTPTRVCLYATMLAYDTQKHMEAVLFNYIYPKLKANSRHF